MIICDKCLCNKCINNVDNVFKDKQNIACFNCDDCYYYGLDDDTKSKNVKFECDNFIVANRYAKANRSKLKLMK